MINQILPQRQHIVELDEDLAEILAFLSSMLDNIIEADKFLNSVASSLHLLLDNCDVMIWQVLERGNHSVFLLSGVASDVHVGQLQEIGILGSQNILEQSLITQQNIYEPNYKLSDIFSFVKDKKKLTSALSVPIVNNKKVIGLILVLGKRPGQFSEQQRLGVQEQAKMISMFLHNGNVLNHIGTLFQDINFMIQEWIADVSSRLTKVQKGEALLGKILSDLSHEFKTPIASLRLYSGLIGKRPEKSEQYLNIMKLEIARIEKLLEGILLLSEFQINSSNMELRPHNLCQLLQTSCYRFRQNLEPKQAERIELICNADLAVEVNEQYFYFAFERLLNNAIQYGDNSKITITMDQVFLNDLSFASITVKDRGPGISSADAPHVFSPFYRGEGVGQSAIFGAGLGLTYAKEIVSSFGGALRLVESDGQGTTMEVRFLDIS